MLPPKRRRGCIGSNPGGIPVALLDPTTGRKTDSQRVNTALPFHRDGDTVVARQLEAAERNPRLYLNHQCQSDVHVQASKRCSYDLTPPGRHGTGQRHTCY